jgi:hypothetical protein
MQGSFLFLGTTYPSLLRDWIIICVLFCVPAGIGFLVLWRFGRKLWAAAFTLGLMSVLPGGLTLAVIPWEATGALTNALLPLFPCLLGLLLCVLSLFHRHGRNA